MNQRFLKLARNAVFLFSLAAITSGCDFFKNRQDSTSSGSPDRISRDSSNLEQIRTPEINTNPINSLAASAGVPDKPQEVRHSTWQLQEGPLGLSNGLWLSTVSLFLGGTAITLGFVNRLSSRKRFDRLGIDYENHDRYIQNLSATIGAATKSIADLRNHQAALHAECEGLKRETTALSSIVEVQKRQSLTAPVRPSESSLSSIFQAITPQQWPTEPKPPSIEVQLANLADAINRGDHQAIRAAVCTQLNITSASENAIVMGRLNETQFEEVSGGGSYLLANIGDGSWLYPTDLTLKGFAQFQPSKGIFHYSSQSISTPQIVAPAQLCRNGSNWQIVKMGTIAVPA